MLEAVRSANPRVGCDAVGTWPGVLSRPFGDLGTLHISFGAVVETSAGLPADGTWIGDKPGLET